MLLLSIMMAMAGFVQADINSKPDVKAPDMKAIEAALAVAVGKAKPDSISPGPVPGLVEVTYGTRVIYISNDGHYIVQGDVFDTHLRRNLTEDKRSAGRQRLMEKVPDEQTIIFSPDKPTHIINVFTDIDCAYCRKLHSQIKTINKLGIKVRYLFYPRAGLRSQSYEKAVSVWCADDQRKAMTEAKAGRLIPKKTCKNPVKDHMALGNKIGVTGTPTILLEEGVRLPGYAPPRELARILGIPAK